MSTVNKKNYKEIAVHNSRFEYPQNSKENAKSFFRKKYTLGRQKAFYLNLFRWSFSKLCNCLGVNPSRHELNSLIVDV